MLFLGENYRGAARVWKIRAPVRCRFFGWLVLHGHCWTSNRLCRHGLRDTDECALCAQDVETLDHLMLRCVYSCEAWFRILCYCSIWRHRGSCLCLIGGWIPPSRYTSLNVKGSIPCIGSSGGLVALEGEKSTSSWQSRASAGASGAADPWGSSEVGLGWFHQHWRPWSS
jgi:hypothetical protein